MTAASRLYGDLDMLILKTLQVAGPVHGLGIIDTIHHNSGEELLIDYGALYRALGRLEERRLVEGEWRMSEKNRRARFYSLTAEGQRVLKQIQIEWSHHNRLVRQILDMIGESP